MIKVGALYQIDDEWRMETATVMPALPATVGTEMVTVTATGMVTGTKYISNYQPFENGLAFLASIENHGSTNHDYDICKIMFANKSGLRYLYRYQLEKAKKVSK